MKEIIDPTQFRSYIRISSEIVAEAFRQEIKHILTEEYDKAHAEARKRADLRIDEVLKTIKFKDEYSNMKSLRTISVEF